MNATTSSEELRRQSDSSCGPKREKLRRAGIVLSIAVLAMAAALVPAQAGAGSTVEGGSLRLDTVDDIAVTLVATVKTDGRAQIAISIPPFIVVDATGSGAGWRVSLTVSDPVDSMRVTPTPNASMSAPIVTGIGSDISNVDGAPLQGNVAIGENIVTARAGFGMCAYLVSPRILEFAIPPTSQRSAYVSTITITLFTAP